MLVAAAKRGEHFAQPRGGGLEFAASVICKRVQRRAGAVRERIAAGAEHAGGRRLKLGREALDMQFADEELRHGRAEFAVREGVSGHLQPVQRIDARGGIAQGFQDSGERADARRQCAGRTLRKAHRAQRAVIESYALMRAAPVRDVGSAARHPLEQVLEQQRVQRHGEGGAAHLRRARQFTRTVREKGAIDLQRVQNLRRRRLAGDRSDQAPEVAHGQAALAAAGAAMA